MGDGFMVMIADTHRYTSDVNYIASFQDVRGYLQKCLNDGKDFNLSNAVNSKTISDGIKYSLATGASVCSVCSRILCVSCASCALCVFCKF